VKTRVLSFGSLTSPLARNQTQAVIDRLQLAAPRLTCQLNLFASPIRNKARVKEPFLATCRGEVEFLEEKLLADEARLAVLEADDMVLPLPEELDILCVPDRGNPFDAFLNRKGRLMDEMEAGGTVGVLSLRARSQLAALWPDLKFEILQGGVDRAMETHLRRSEIDGLVLPAAVTEHLGIQGIVAEIFSPEFVLPGPGQGLLVVIGRTTDQEARTLLQPLHSEASAAELMAEQAFCARMISDQDLPVGALARVEQSQLVITGTTGSGLNRLATHGPVEKAASIGDGLATRILSRIDTFADLLEADFPDGLPEDGDSGTDEMMDDLDLEAGDEVEIDEWVDPVEPD